MRAACDANIPEPDKPREGPGVLYRLNPGSAWPETENTGKKFSGRGERLFTFTGKYRRKNRRHVFPMPSFSLFLPSDRALNRGWV